MENYFKKLYDIDVADKVEHKNNLTYLSWAYAWGELKKIHPTANYTVYENKDGIFYFTDGRTCWVKTGVTVEGLEHIEYLPVMDFRNNSILAEKVTSFDVNKAIQRSLTKAVARHGLGLKVYAGEDLPETPKQNKEETKEPIKLITEQQKEHLSFLGTDFKKLEKYCGKAIDKLTFEEAEQAIAKKEKQMEG